MPRHWFLKSSHGQTGPITSKQLMRLVDTGKVLPETGVSADGDLWIKASKITGLSFPESPSNHWYVKTGGGIAGPFTFAKLQKLTATGRIKPTVAISSDREHWVPAKKLAGLTFLPSATPLKKPPEKPPKEPPTVRSDETLITKYARRFGVCDRVSRAEVDVRIYPANEQRPITTLVTSGLSEQVLPSGEHSISPRRELILYVDRVHEAHVQLMRCLARAIIAKTEPFGFGHVIANRQPAKPIFRGSALDHFLIMIPQVASDFAIRSAHSIDGDELHLMSVVPITEAEKTIVEQQGMQSFCHLLDQSNHSLTLKPKRPCYASAKPPCPLGQPISYDHELPCPSFVVGLPANHANGHE